MVFDGMAEKCDITSSIVKYIMKIVISHDEVHILSQLLSSYNKASSHPYV